MSTHLSRMLNLNFDVNRPNFKTRGIRKTFVTRSRGESVILTKKRGGMKECKTIISISPTLTKITVTVHRTAKEKVRYYIITPTLFY